MTGKLDAEEEGNLSEPIKLEEVVATTKSSNPNKSLGPDGFNATFFKICWPIIGFDMYEAVSNFFSIGMLLKQVKNNFIALIPKCSSPLKVTVYRPISLANELYKIIVRVIAGRLKLLMPRIISPF